MKKLIFTFLIVVCLSFPAFNSVVHAEIPTIAIMGVTGGEKVTIQTNGFPEDRDFEVRMGVLGTKGMDGILVGTFNSGTDDFLLLTLMIPAALESENIIVIRLESTTGNYYAYNWFSNVTYGTHEGGVEVEDIAVSEPTIWVPSVKQDTYAIVRGSGFAPDESLEVLMGEYETQGEDGIVVDSFNADDEGKFSELVNIPESLKSENKIDIRVESKDTTLAVTATFDNKTGSSGGTDSAPGTGYSTGIPTISIVSVEEDQDVTIQTYNFPANKEFKVLMGLMGTRGINGIQVTTIDSGEGGSFLKTFEIPDALKGKYQIAIRLQTADGYYYSYNWFYNNTASAGVPSGYSGIPTFSISSVVTDDTVTIKTNNFPKDVDFKVLMGKMGTRGIGGIEVETINSGTGGSFTNTFDIPAALAGEYQIAIRLEAVSGGFYAYNWFYNDTASTSVPSGYSGIPTFSISAVVKDDTVTIKTNNLPKDIDFKVLMGEMGTRGIGGITVETINSGSGGTITDTFDIPAALAGDKQIAIRLEAASGGFYAYNWFYNSNYP